MHSTLTGSQSDAERDNPHWHRVTDAGLEATSVAHAEGAWALVRPSRPSPEPNCDALSFAS